MYNKSVTGDIKCTIKNVYIDVNEFLPFVSPSHSRHEVVGTLAKSTKAFDLRIGADKKLGAIMSTVAE